MLLSQKRQVSGQISSASRILPVVPAELELHVDEHDVALVEELAQERVHPQRRLVDGGQLLRASRAAGSGCASR